MNYIYFIITYMYKQAHIPPPKCMQDIHMVIKVHHIILIMLNVGYGKTYALNSLPHRQTDKKREKETAESKILQHCLCLPNRSGHI